MFYRQKNPSFYACAIICAASIISPFYSMAQQQILTKGNVTSQGEALSNVIIKIKNSNTVTRTDSNGDFVIATKIGDVIIVSYVGYQTQDIKIQSSAPIQINLISEQNELEEVTIVGYGTQKTKDLTGAVGTLKADAFKSQPILNAANALQGRLSGVAVTQNSGAPGGQAKIRVRGSNSINGTNEPLYVVDGIALTSFNLQDLNPNDIESIDVQKDASATAIYGSRGANGVILITTKKGKVGVTIVNYDGFVNFNTLPKRYKLMDAETYASMANLYTGSPVFANPSSYADKTTDWQKLLFKNSQTINQQLSVSGGGEKARFFISGYYQNQDGIRVNTHQKKYGLRSNTDVTINNKLSLGLNIFAQRVDSKNNGVDQSKSNPVMASVTWAPTQEPYNDLGEYNRNAISPIWPNPLMSALESSSNSFANIASFNGNIRYKIIDGLTFTSNAGLDASTTKSASLSNNWISPTNMGASQGYGEVYSFQNSNILNYDKTIAEKHYITVTAVEETTVSKSQGFSANGTGLSSLANGYYNLGLNSNQNINSNYSRYSLLSFLGRATYNYDNKYLATVSLRRDASSKFQKNNRWSSFPSFSLGWNLHEESFLKDNQTINRLKLRGGFGMTGNQAIPPYATLGLFNPVNYGYATTNATLAYQVGNPTAKDLKWETTKQTNIGFDLGLLKNRLNFVFDYYNKDTEDLLLATPIPFYLGGGNQWKNVGEVNNKGFEFSAEASIIEKESFKWNSNFNISYNENKVVKLNEGEDMILQSYIGSGFISSQIQTVKVGEPLGSFYLIPWEGVYQQNDPVLNKKAGDYKYKDVSGNKSIGYEDREVSGSAMSKVQMGFTNNFSYKNFDLNIFIQGAYGQKMFNATYAATAISTSDVMYPTLEAASNYWSPTNPSNEWSSPTSTSKKFVESSQFLEDASFTRLKNVSLTYKLSKSTMRFCTASIGFAVQNLLTVTKYKGYDPEATTTLATQDNVSGIDLGAYPTPRTYTVRLNLTF